MTRKVFSLIKYIALISLLAVSVVVVFEQYKEIKSIEENEYRAVQKSLQSANERISMYFKVLRGKVELSAYRESAAISQIFADPYNSDIAEALIRRVRNQLPGAFAVTIADINGVPLITDFEGLIGDICLQSIQKYSQDQGEYLIQVHPHPVSTHFDIMVRLDSSLNQHMGVFFVSFELDELVRILNKSQLPGHQLYLLLEQENNMIEVTPEGSRSKLGNDIWLSEDESARIMDSIYVEGTRWKMVDIPKSGVLSHKLNLAIAKLVGYIALILLMLTTIIISLRQELRAQRELRGLNQALENKVLQRTKNLEAANNRSRMIVEFASDAIISIDKQQVIKYFNESAEKMFGYSRDEIIGKPLSILLPEQYRAIHEQHIKEFANESVSNRSMRERTEIECLRKDGVIFPAEANICRIEENGEVLFTAFVHDLTALKAKERSMMAMAMSDELTGLANRRYFDDQLERAIANAKRLNNKVGIMMIDMDYFKEVNDTHGHLVGDKLLKKVAAEFKACLRQTDVVGRIGGDEFAVVITGLEDSGELYSVAQKMIERVRRIKQIDAIPLNSTVSIGMSVFPDHSETIETLVACADKALYFAKKAGRNTCHLYSSQVSEEDH
jgi:diguanylate cyclase (GGDEF)-like protein/PAS domain S-box-containing protein